MPQQHHLHHAVRYQFFYLADDIFWISAALPSSHVRNDTVAAEIIAAEHDVDAGFKSVFAVRRQILHDLIRSLPDIHNHIVRFHPPDQKFGKLEDIMRSKNQIHKRVAFPDFFHHLRFLHHTAAQSDHHMGILLFQAVQIAQMSIHFQIGVLPHCAGVIEHQVSVIFLPFCKTGLLQNSLQFLRIPGVHLTAEGNAAKPEDMPEFISLFFHDFF